MEQGVVVQPVNEELEKLTQRIHKLEDDLSGWIHHGSVLIKQMERQKTEPNRTSNDIFYLNIDQAMLRTRIEKTQI